MDMVLGGVALAAGWISSHWLGLLATLAALRVFGFIRETEAAHRLQLEALVRILKATEVEHEKTREALFHAQGRLSPGDFAGFASTRTAHAETLHPPDGQGPQP